MTNGTILLVEDHPDDEFLTLRALSKARMTDIVVTHEGIEALDYLYMTLEDNSRTGPPLPKLVIVDLRMPRMDGIDMIRELRSQPLLDRLPVVVLSSSINPSDVETCLELGISGYLRKPLDTDELRRVFADLDENTKTAVHDDRDIHSPVVPT